MVRKKQIIVDQFEGLRDKLKDLEFPSKYMYKFITSQENIALLRPCFQDAEITVKQSSKGKYNSFTAVTMAMNPEQIIDKYKSLSHIKGLISL